MSFHALARKSKLGEGITEHASERFLPKSQNPSLSGPSVPETNLMKTTHKWREATSKDLRHIAKLVDSEVTKFYGDVNLAALVEHSPYAMVIEDEEKQVAGFICLNSYPNISALFPEVWTDWIKHHYKLNELHNQNTLFVHYIAWSYMLRPDYLKIYLEDLFLSDIKLEYICLVAPPNEAGVSFTRKNFIRLHFSRTMPVGSFLPTKIQSVHICFRSSLISKMKIRRALAEDNDDLVEILDATSPKLRRYYGDYYIAEIVLKKEPNRSIIVAEINNQTVGMMCLNINVDLEKLNLNFELIPFHALRKFDINAGFDEVEVRDIMTRESRMFFMGFQPDNPEAEAYFSGSSLSNIRYASTSTSFSLNESQHEDDPSEKRILEQLQAQVSQTTQMAKEFDIDLMREWEEEFRKFEGRTKYYNEFIRQIQLPLSDSNVMAIELFGMQHSLDERMSIDLLKAAFDTYQDRDYILLTMPTTAYLPKFLTYFTKVIPRPDCTFPDNVYVIHKNNLAGCFSVSYMSDLHWTRVQDFLDYKGPKQTLPALQIIRICEDFLTNPKSQFSVLIVQSLETIVGIIILKPATEIESIRQLYCLDTYENFDVITSPGNFGQIVYCYMTPLLLSYSRFIFKEIFRLTSYLSIFYYIKKDTKYLDFYNSLLPMMRPMKPRRVMSLPEITSFEDIEADQQVYDEEEETSAIFYMNVRLGAFQRKQVDSRIVLIGFGQTSKTFLETLIYRKESQHVFFTNVTCICPAGILEADMTYAGDSSKLFSPHKLFPSTYLQQLEMRVWVNFVSGYMTRIDRKNKLVVLDNKEQVPYDKLFLFCGVQFDVPLEVYSEKTPANLVLVNKLLHGKMIHYRLKALMVHSGYNLIVYGSVPKAYAGVNYLLNSGVKGEHIHFIIPPLENFDEINTQVFDDDVVEYVVYRELEKNGVNVYQNFKFVTWSVDKEINMIKNITFESRFECITISCALFISYYRKVVNRMTVKALNRSGLVFDGRIVIDAYCRTNDPNIYAAGPLTKYRRILYADRYRHIYYNSKEIGLKLAIKIIENYYKNDGEETPKEGTAKWIVPNYTFSMVESIQLPGNYYYIHIHQPGFQLPNYLAKSLDNYGVDLVTGGPAMSDPEFFEEKPTGKSDQLDNPPPVAEQDYFRIYLDKQGFVKRIVCLSKKPFNGQNLIRIYGLHEKLLNNLKCKYKQGEITDLFEFFSERWSYLLNHDRFFKLLEMNDKVYRNNLDGNTDWLTEYLKLETNGHKVLLPETKRQGLIRYYQSKEFRVEIQRNLLRFIDEYKGTLFMYATPEGLMKESEKNL